MEMFLQWLRSDFMEPSSTQTIIVLSLICSIGLLLGRFRVKKIGLGVTFVFFTGILFAHLGVQSSAELLTFAQSFGLAIFVYALGVEVGPSFFPSLKHQGIIYNLYGIGLMVITYVMVLLFHYGLDIPMPQMLGIMSGSSTNTPVLAAVQSTLQSTPGTEPTTITEATLAGAVTYPLGVLGVIIALIVLHYFLPSDAKREKEEFRQTYVTEMEIQNPDVCGKSVQELGRCIDRPFIISRIWRQGILAIPTAETVLRQGDHILLLSKEEDTEKLEKAFGKRSDRMDWNRPDINWDEIDASFASKRIVITNPKVNGAKLGSLKLRNRYGITITRIHRAGIELLATPDLYLQHGDRLMVVGEAGALSQVALFLGDSIQMLDRPKLISFFAGIALGCMLGTIPFVIPGMSMPIRWGLAGGPIIMGILMGAFGPRLHIVTYMTSSATQLIKQFGLSIFFAALGLASGGRFVETLLHGGGLLWVGIGFLLTIVPVLVTGFVAVLMGKCTYAETAGFLSGTMANPMALDFACDQLQDAKPSVAYATVYPVAMFLRIISAQIILLFFL